MRKVVFLFLGIAVALGIAGCGTIETPQFDLPEGLYDSEFNAKITNLKRGESAYYTLNGLEPSQSSLLYSEEGIPLTEGENEVRVIKCDAKGNCSQVLTAVFTIAPQTPQLDIPDGVYDEEFKVIITNLDRGYKAYYTLDGSEPNENSSLYTRDGIPVTEGENQVKVIKYDVNGNCSDVFTATFTVKIQTPRLATPDGEYNAEFNAIIVNLKEGYKAYYTLDGSEPSEGSSLYTEAGIPLKDGENLIKTIKYDRNGNRSEVMTATLNIVPYEPDYSNYFTTLHKQGDVIYYVQNLGGPSLAFVYDSQLRSYNIADGSSDVVLDKDITQFIIQDGVVFGVVFYDYASEEEKPYPWYSYVLGEDDHQALLPSIAETFDFYKYRDTGIMVDKWIYYEYSKEGNWNLYRTNVSTMKTEPVSQEEGLGPAILVDRDILYWGPERNLYRFNVDSAENIRISSDRGSSCKVFGGFIYLYTAEPKKSVYRLRLDGTGQEQIPTAPNREFVVVGDRIYYATSNGIYSMRIDGADNKKVCSNIPQNLQYYRGKLYFNGSSTSNRHSLYCLDLATNEVTLLFEGHQEGHLYFIEGETYYVYTQVHKGEAGLYRVTETSLELLAGQGD